MSRGAKSISVLCACVSADSAVIMASVAALPLLVHASCLWVTSTASQGSLTNVAHSEYNVNTSVAHPIELPSKYNLKFFNKYSTKTAPRSILQTVADDDKLLSFSREEAVNNAAEEIDHDDEAQTRLVSMNAETLKPGEDDNDADEHEDYDLGRGGDDDYHSDPLPLVVTRRRKRDVRQRERRSDSERENEWPELLPTPLAQYDEECTRGCRRDDGTYVVKDDEGEECIRAYFQATIRLSYPANGPGGKEEIKTLVTRPPESATVSGKCDRSHLDGTLEITWEPGTFTIAFDFDSLTDSWYVSKFQFAFNTGKKIFKDSSTDKEVTVVSENRRYWTTSKARSFRCMLLHDIEMTSEQFAGTVHFDEVRVQALTYGDRFKPPKHCLHRVHRDERVPLIVGCTLAALTVLTIGIYAGLRYIKVKKVQYDTMQ